MCCIARCCQGCPASAALASIKVCALLRGSPAPAPPNLLTRLALNCQSSPWPRCTPAQFQTSIEAFCPCQAPSARLRPAALLPPTSPAGGSSAALQSAPQPAIAPAVFPVSPRPRCQQRARSLLCQHFVAQETTKGCPDTCVLPCRQVLLVSLDCVPHPQLLHVLRHGEFCNRAALVAVCAGLGGGWL